MVRPLFASVFAIAFTMPGCPKTDAPPTPPPMTAVRGPRIGDRAPDIVGVDLDGEPIRLGDYRGKVVALSFWADWCHVCRELFPHEKELVEKYGGQPFVLLGVNGDDSPERAKRVHDKNQLNWRSFFAGDPEGMIPTQWGVKAWPTTFLIDARGIVRFRIEGRQPHAVERGIQSLFREMETGKKTS